MSKLCNCGGLEEWTAPSFCPEAGPALSWPGHHGDKKRKGQRAVRNSVHGSGQQCEENGLKGEGRWTRILSDKTHQGLLICEGLIQGYRVSCWADEQNDTAGTNKRALEDHLGLNRTYTGKTGKTLPTHKHTHKHTSLLSSGFHTIVAFS